MTSGVIGSFVGAIAGFMGKWVDSILMRLVDVTLAFPPILLAMGIAARFPAANELRRHPPKGGAVVVGPTRKRKDQGQKRPPPCKKKKGLVTKNNRRLSWTNGHPPVGGWLTLNAVTNCLWLKGSIAR